MKALSHTSWECSKPGHTLSVNVKAAFKSQANYMTQCLWHAHI